MLLVGCFLTWIYWITGGEMSGSRIMSCQLYRYCLYGFRHASVWLLVIMTGERSLSILLPFRAKTFSTIKMAKTVSGITVLFWGIFHTQWFFLVKTVKRPNQNTLSCQYLVSAKYGHFYHLFDNVVYSLLPCILIFLFNIIIIVKLVFARRKSLHF